MFSPSFNIEWYGQRCASKLFANYFVRRFIRLLEIVFKKSFGFFGKRESYTVVPLTFWREPKDFVLVLTKKNV